VKASAATPIRRAAIGCAPKLIIRKMLSTRPRMSGGARIWSKPFAVVSTTGIVSDTKKIAIAA